MEVVEIEQVFGCGIDRAANNRIKFNEIKNGKANFRAYVPVEIYRGDELPMTMRVVVKITTPVKLNLLTKDDQELISSENLVEAYKKEVHYV